VLKTASSEGYGRNFIIPSKTGVIADNKNLNTLKLQKQNEDKIAAEKLAEAQALKEKIEQIKLTITVKSGKDGRTFGSVSTKQIAERLNRQGFQIDKKKILDTAPIQTLGTTKVRVELHKNVIGTINVKLTGSEG
jgi:large subunit ribosomal protein L9